VGSGGIYCVDAGPVDIKELFMTKDEALDLALEALEDIGDEWGFTSQRTVPKRKEAITAIKQVRALDKKAENARELGLDYGPVAWMYELIIDGEVCNVECTNVNWNPEYQPFGRAGIDFVESGKVTKTPLYTTPPAAQRTWVGLPDDDVYLLAHPRLARAIETKLKEKNT
jgi:hypothetical protein